MYVIDLRSFDVIRKVKIRSAERLSLKTNFHVENVSAGPPVRSFIFWDLKVNFVSCYQMRPYNFLHPFILHRPNYCVTECEYVCVCVFDTHVSERRFFLDQVFLEKEVTKLSSSFYKSSKKNACKMCAEMTISDAHKDFSHLHSRLSYSHPAALQLGSA
jgi:hypothetical protein